MFLQQTHTNYKFETAKQKAYTKNVSSRKGSSPFGFSVSKIYVGMPKIFDKFL